MTHFRWTICALLFFATTINYMDRQILGILAPELQKHIGWSEVEYGHIVTAFQAAYAIGLLAFGRLVDSIGTRHGYAISIIMWSIAAAAHALARTAFGFGLARFVLGLGEAGNFPAAVKTVAEWFPRKERALANGIFNSGANVGAVVAPATVPWMAEKFGWQAAFIVLGLLGFVWLALWYWLYTTPELSTRVSDGERAYIQSEPPDPPAAPIPWSQLLGYRQTWTIIVGFAFSSPIWWFYLYWLPKFLNKQYGLELSKLGPPLIAIYTLTCFGSIGGGWLSSLMLRRGFTTNHSRKTAMLICALCVVPVVFAGKAANVWVATALVGLAAAAHQGWAANLFALASDMFPKRAIASVIGLASMAGSLAAMVFSQTAGQILEKIGSYWPLFIVAGCAYVTALTAMHLLAPKLDPVEIKTS